MSGGGGTTTWMVGEVATEDEEEEGRSGTEVVICSFDVGDKTSGVRGCNTVGSKTSPVTKVSDRVLTRVRGGKYQDQGFERYRVLRKRKETYAGKYDLLNRLLLALCKFPRG
jgi:hypothetical protein